MKKHRVVINTTDNLITFKQGYCTHSNSNRPKVKISVKSEEGSQKSQAEVS